ncbi:MAG: hypothetical protein HOY69_38680 [Streptomyces sp.]|nr:hypothetical protein [Streptomyces sp.]
MISTCSNVVDHLDAEWPVLCADPRAAKIIIGWLVEAGVFAPGQAPASLAQVLPQLKRGDRTWGREHSDRWLGAVLSRAVQRDADGRLAARFAVQAMLPGAVVTARRMRPFGHSRGEVLHTVVTALYEVIRQYPLERKPRKVAANLLLDALRSAHRELQRDSVDTFCSELPVGVSDPQLGPDRVAELRDLAAAARATGLPGLIDAHPEDIAGACEQVIELLLWALDRKVLDHVSAGAVSSHYRSGAPEDEVAARAAGVQAGAWRQRRSRAVRRLRQAAEGWSEKAA